MKADNRDHFKEKRMRNEEGLAKGFALVTDISEIQPYALAKHVGSDVTLIV